MRLKGIASPRLTNAVQALLEEHHPEEPCFYLQWLAVAPDKQGSGIGSELLTHDEAMGELTVGGSPPLWPMWREPE